MVEYSHHISVIHDGNTLKIVLSRQVKGTGPFQDIYCLTLTDNILTKTSLISKELVDGDGFVDIFKTASISRGGADYLLLSIESFLTIKVASNQITICQNFDGPLPNLSIRGYNVYVKTLKTSKLSVHAEACSILGEVIVTQLQVSGKLINSGKMHIKSMSLAGSTFNNEGVLATNEMIFPTGSFTNTGTWSHTGKFKSDSLNFTNGGSVEWENVQWDLTPSMTYYNHKSWIFDNVTASDKIHIYSWGLLYFKNSVLEFSCLIGHNTIFSSGQYCVKALQNFNLISFIDNEWTMTDKAMLRAGHYLCVDGKGYGPVGKIESEKTLHYDIPKLPDSITGCQDIHLSAGSNAKQTRTIADLVNIKCSGSVYIMVKSLDITDLEITNINNLVMSVLGNSKITKSFKTLGLQLDVRGDITIGSSNTSMGIIATKGPLLIKCWKLDNRFGKIYGSGVSITSSGDVLVGAAISKGPFLYGVNGSYIASGDYLRITSANEIKNQYGQLFSQKDQKLEAKTKIDNIAGEIMCGADINIETPSFANTRDATYTQPVANWTWAYSGCYNYCESSDQACIRALGSIHFAVDTGLNLASTILAQGKITYQDAKSKPKPNYKSFLAAFVEKKSTVNQVLPTSFTSQGRTNYGYGCNDRVGYQQGCSPCSSYPATIKSGEAIQIATGSFQISGSLSSPIITISANSGSFHNKDRYRATVNQTETLFIDMTQIIQSYAKSPGILKLTDKGEVTTDFDSLSRADKKLPIDRVFDPLLSLPTTIFDLFIQSTLSEVAGKIYLNDKQSNKSLSKRLWSNATKFQQLIGNRQIAREQIKQTSHAMLIKEIQEVNKVIQESTILCLPPNEVSPYQSFGDISSNEFTCVTEDDQIHLNNRIVARDLLKVVSKTGSISRGTEAYTMTIHANDSITTQDMAMPTQTMVCSHGDVSIEAHKNIASIGTYTEGVSINEKAQTGSITSAPLILQRIVESKRETDDGFFSTTTVTDRQTSYTAVESVTKSDKQTHKQASNAIIQTATHDVAGEQLIYEAHDLAISSVIMADRTEHHEGNDNGFTQKTLAVSKETPSVLNASVTAPKIQIKCRQAKINGVMITGDTVEDYTDKGLILGPVVQKMHYSQQMTVESPLASADVGCKGGYEVMLPTRVSVKKIVRMIQGGQIKMDSVQWDKNKTKIIGKFVETTYTLKQWQITWNISKQVIPAEAMIIVSLAISYATMGMGTGLGMGATLTGFTGTAGVMASAGFTTLCNAAAVSLLQTGDPIAVTKSIFSNNFLRTLAINVAAAGLCSSISNHLCIDMNPGIGDAKFTDFLKVNGLHAAVNIPLRTVIGRESMDQVVRTEIMNGLVDTLAMKMASIIGQRYRTGKLNFTEQKLCHAVSGGISGGLMAVIDDKPIKSGVLGGAIGAVASETVGELNPLEIQNIQGRLTFSKITAGAVAMMTGKNSADVTIAVRTGSITVENNLWPCILAGLTALGWTHVVHDTIETYNDAGLNDAVDTLIVNGIVMRLANGIAHYGGRVYRVFRGVKNPYASYKPPQLEAPKMVKHHVFNVFRGTNPEKQKYRDFFRHHKIDIDSHTIQITEGFHKKIIHGTNDWTKRWMSWIDTNPTATTKDVYQFAGKLMDEYNVAHIPIHKYK